MSVSSPRSEASWLPALSNPRQSGRAAPLEVYVRTINVVRELLVPLTGLALVILGIVSLV